MLADHYTALGQQHREKVCFLVGVYFALGQVLTFTPTTVLDSLKTSLLTNQLVPDMLTFGGGIACLVSLLTVGILHHLCNLVSYSALRLDYERRCLVADMARNPNEWEKAFGRKLRTKMSLSKPSAAIAGFFAAVIWGLVLLRFNYLLRYLFDESTAVTLFAGGFFVIQTLILLVYGIALSARARRFYQARELLKLFELNASDEEIVDCLARFNVKVTEEEIANYWKKKTPPASGRKSGE